MTLADATKLIDDYFDGNINLTSTEVAIAIHDSAQNGHLYHTAEVRELVAKLRKIVECKKDK